jgi:hypothetical protein
LTEPFSPAASRSLPRPSCARPRTGSRPLGSLGDSSLPSPFLTSPPLSSGRVEERKQKRACPRLFHEHSAEEADTPLPQSPPPPNPPPSRRQEGHQLPFGRSFEAAVHHRGDQLYKPRPPFALWVISDIPSRQAPTTSEATRRLSNQDHSTTTSARRTEKPSAPPTEGLTR